MSLLALLSLSLAFTPLIRFIPCPGSFLCWLPSLVRASFAGFSPLFWSSFPCLNSLLHRYGVAAATFYLRRGRRAIMRRSVASHFFPRSPVTNRDMVLIASSTSTAEFPGGVGTFVAVSSLLHSAVGLQIHVDLNLVLLA